MVVIVLLLWKVLTNTTVCGIIYVIIAGGLKRRKEFIMKKKILKSVSLILCACLLLGIGAVAAVNSEEIKAILSYNVKVEYDGKVQTLKDANNKKVYPVTYNGTTYLPVRAVANLFDVPVDWNEETQTVILGQDKSKAPELHDYTLTKFNSLKSTKVDNTHYKYVNIKVDDTSKYYYFGGDYQSLYDGQIKIAKVLDPSGNKVKHSTVKFKEGTVELEENCDKSTYACLSGLVKTGTYKVLITWNRSANYQYVKFKTFNTDYKLN